MLQFSEVWVSDLPGVFVADETGLSKTFTATTPALICKMLTENDVVGLQPSILWGDTHPERVNMGHKDYDGIIGEEPQSYPLQRLNSVPCHTFEIQTTPPLGNPAFTLAYQLILVVTLSAGAEMFHTVIHKLTYGTDINLVNSMDPENMQLTKDDLKTSLDKPELQWDIHLILYDTSIYLAKQSTYGQLSYC